MLNILYLYNIFSGTALARLDCTFRVVPVIHELSVAGFVTAATHLLSRLPVTQCYGSSVLLCNFLMIMIEAHASPAFAKLRVRMVRALAACR